MKFLHSKYQFKAAAHVLEEYLRGRSPGTHVSELDLLGVLWSQAQLSESEVFASGIKRLTDYLNSRPATDLGHTEVLQLLSKAFLGEPYQHLEAKIRNPTAFREIFPDAKVAACSLRPGERMEHPFPIAYRGLGYLENWREIWERDAISTNNRAFIPPILPPSYFDGGSIKYEYRRSWKIKKGGCGEAALRDDRCADGDGTCCILVRGPRGRPVAAVRWYWWGHHDRLAGVEYTLVLQRQSKWFFTQFDLRHDRHDPSYGPSINVIQGVKPDRFIQDCFDAMRCISPYKA